MKAKHILRRVVGTLIGLLLAAAPAPAAADDFVNSLHPLHPGREEVVEPAFEGTWLCADSSSLLMGVTRTDDGYSLVLFSKDDKEKFYFEVHLVRLGRTVFADIRQTNHEEFFLLKPHIFAKIRVDQDELRFDFLSDDFVKDALGSGRTDLAHEWLDGTLVLTAPTRELQDFVESCAFDNKAYDSTEGVSFTRMKEPPDDSNS